MKFILLFLVLISTLNAVDTFDMVDTLDVRKFYHLEGITVIAQSPQASIGSIDTKFYDDDFPHADLTIAEALSDMPGIFFSVGGKGESNIRMRGFEKQQIKVFVDGRPLSTGYFGNLDLHLVPITDIARVNVLKGPVSPLFGFNTMGGVINIITSKRAKDKSLVFRSNYNYPQTGSSSLIWSHHFAQFQAHLSASYFKSKGYYLPQNLKPIQKSEIKQGSIRTNSDREQYNLSIRLNTDIFDMHSLEISSGFAHMPQKGNPPSIYPHPDDRYSRIEAWTRYQNSLLANFYLSDRIQLSSNLFQDYYEDTYISYTDQTYETEEWQSLIKNRTIGTHINTKMFLWNKWQNDCGIRLEQKRYDRKGGPGYETNWVANSQTIGSLYHQFELSLPLEIISLTMGNSITSYTHSAQENSDFYWQPQVGLFAEIRDLNLSISFTSAYQFPTMHQLFSHSSGNIELKPEYANKYEVMLHHPLPENYGSGKLVLFYNDVNDLIGRNGYLYENQEKLTTYGTEFSLKMNLLPRFTQDYQWSFIAAKESRSSIPLYDQPKNKLNLAHNIAVADKFQLSFISEWTDKRLCTDRVNQQYQLPDYWIHNVKLTYDFNFLQASLTANNLLDKYYEPEYGYPAAGREFTVSIKIPIY